MHSCNIHEIKMIIEVMNLKMVNDLCEVLEGGKKEKSSIYVIISKIKKSLKNLSGDSHNICTTLK